MSKRLARTFSFKNQHQLDNLSAIAEKWVFFHQGQANPSGLIQAIADGDLVLTEAVDWSFQEQEAIYQLLVIGRESGYWEAVEEIGRLALAQRNLAPSLRSSISEIVKKARLPILEVLQQLIQNQQPFKIAYNNSAGEDEIFTCTYAHLEAIERHRYLVVRVTEQNEKSEHPDLAFNRCFRLDRIVAVQPELGFKWSELNYIEVAFWLYGSWTSKYEPKIADVEPNLIDWINSPLESGETIRQVRWRVWSIFWFLREVMRYGEMQIISPNAVREVHIQKLLQPLKYYDKQGEIPLSF